MAQTTTLRAHGATLASDARFRSPLSLQASRYFISPARPAAIHVGKCSSSGESEAGAIPDRSKPACSAARLTIAFTSLIEFVTDFVLEHRRVEFWRELLISQSETTSRCNATFFLPSLFQGIRILPTESRTFPARSPKFHSKGETIHATTSARATSDNSDIRHQREHRADRC